METYEEWLGNPDDLDRFQEIQYEKKLFPASAPPEIIYQFCKGLPKQLQEFQLSLLNGTTNKHIRKFAGKSDIYIIKMRINDNWRAVMLLRDHLLTLLMVTDHDSQADAIERKFTGAAFARLQDRIGREKNGLVMKPMHEFLHLCYIFFNRGRSKCTANAFKKAFNSEVDYILDRNQKRTVDTVNNTTITNVIVIGNAGAGKSTAGLIWLTKYPDRKAKRLYLTMSDLLADTYQNKYHRANSLREQMGLPQLPAITFHTVFGFMADTARRFVDEGSGLLTPEQSFQVFGEAMREAGEDARTSFCRTLSENAGLKYLYWREIHGIIKGSLIDRALGTPDFTLSSPLGKKAYEAAARRHREKMARKFKRVEGETYIRREKLFDVFHVYQRYLKQHQMLDDNDIARIVFEHKDEIEQQQLDIGADLAFVDECQDMTELQLLALFTLLGECKQRYIASDRCQIVRPTYYYTGFMQQLLEASAKQHQQVRSMRYTLNDNYRSTNAIKRLQNQFLTQMESYHNLTVEEKQHVPLNEDEDPANSGNIIWIYDTPKNRKSLQKIQEKLPAGYLFPIYANPQKRPRRTMDVVSCKGVSLLSVALLGVFEEASRYVGTEDPMAWDFLYVGLTRAERNLIIVERPDNPAGEFLSRCDGIAVYDRLDGREQELQDILMGVSADDIIDEAYRLYQNANYLQAADIFSEYMSESEEYAQMVEICLGMSEAQDMNYSAALDHFIQLHQMDPDRGNEFFQKLRAEHSLDAYQTLRMNIIGLSDEHYQDGLYCHSNGLMDIYDEYQHHTKNPKPLKQILESLDGTDDRVLPYLDDWYEQTMQRLQDELKELAGQAEEYTKGRKANG